MPLPTCTLVGCNLQSPVADNSACAPDGIDGEITGLYLTDTAPADNTEFTTFDNTVAGGMKYVKVKGNLNEPEQGSVVAEGGVTLFSKLKTRSIAFETYNLSDTMWTFWKTLECGKPLLMFIEVGGEYILGGEATFLDGIPTVVQASPVSDGEGSFLRMTGSASWKARYMPERIVKP